jgi:hypothetical protein
MKKFKLDVEALAVDTFATGDNRDGDGTVRGNLYAEKPTTSVNNQITCGDQSCVGASCVSCSLCITEPTDEFDAWA